MAAIAVYCGSSMGKRKAYYNAALSLGHALAEANRRLIYGGGSHGIMGVISGAVLEGGGNVTGILPYAIQVGGGEREKLPGSVAENAELPGESQRDRVETIVVNSMHERKVEMAGRAEGFIGLPGGFGTFEEILEVTTWTQLGIHSKPVVLLNVLSFFEPLRLLIKKGVAEGYIHPSNEQLIIFVDGPPSHDEHEGFDWGKAGLEAIDAWQTNTVKVLFDWTRRLDGKQAGEEGVLGVV